MTETFIVDFPDAMTAKIYTDRWVHSASLLGIVYQHSITPYGEGKFHYRAAMDGNVHDVERFMSFINESLALLDNSELKNEN
jgi:hypothetical protein